MDLLNNTLRIVRYDDSNKNLEALRGQYAQTGETNYSVTILKNILFINLYKGAKVEIRLPNVYDGFLISSEGRRFKVVDNVLIAELRSDETAFGQLVLKKWN